MKMLDQKRRLYDRVAVEGAMISFQERGWFSIFGASKGDGPVADLGKGGLSFVSREKLEEGTEISFQLTGLEEASVSSVKGTALVIWRSNIEEQNAFHYGIEFLDLSKDALNTIEKIVENSFFKESNVNTIVKRRLHSSNS